MFEFLFKYPAELFAQGSYVLTFPGWQLGLIALGILAITFVLLGYSSLHGGAKNHDRLAAALLRSLAISLVLFSLSRPLLEVTTQIPQPNVVGVLLDNSISMKVRDFAGAPRSDLIGQQFDTETGSLLRLLQQKFDARLFKFGEDTQAITDVKTLDYGDGDSNLGRALEVVQEALKGEPIAGLVVISDGAMKSTEKLIDPLLSLRAEGIPVYSIGVGQVQYQRDIEISQVKLPRQVLRGSRVMAKVAISQQGYDGQMVDLLVEDDSRILHKQGRRRQPHSAQAINTT